MKIFSSLNIAALLVIITVNLLNQYNPGWEPKRERSEAMKEMGQEDILKEDVLKSANDNSACNNYNEDYQS